MPIGMMRAQARSGAMELELCSHTQEMGTFWTRTQMKSLNRAGLGKDRMRWGTYLPISGSVMCEGSH